MHALILTHLVIGSVGLLVLLFVALRYGGHVLPKTKRISQAVVAVADRVDPGEAPPQGVLTTPEKSRRIARRFERAERELGRRVRALTVARGNG